MGPWLRGKPSSGHTRAPDFVLLWLCLGFNWPASPVPTGSSNSSKYFASNDSSDTSRKARKTQDASERSAYDKCVEDSLWTMIQHTPEPVMMTYQIRPRYPSPGRPVACVSVRWRHTHCYSCENMRGMLLSGSSLSTGERV